MLWSVSFTNLPQNDKCRNCLNNTTHVNFDADALVMLMLAHTTGVSATIGNGVCYVSHALWSALHIISPAFLVFLITHSHQASYEITGVRIVIFGTQLRGV